jgi:hypothetical protein
MSIDGLAALLQHLSGTPLGVATTMIVAAWSISIISGALTKVLHELLRFVGTTGSAVMSAEYGQATPQNDPSAAERGRGLASGG